MRWLVVLFVAGCLDHPLGADPPDARVIASWDPLACTAPERIRVELDGEQVISGSSPCAIGSVVLDVPSFGTYRVRAGGAGGMRDAGDLEVEQPVIAWEVPP